MKQQKQPNWGQKLLEKWQKSNVMPSDEPITPSLTGLGRITPQSLIILALIWLVGVICDRLWLSLDHTVPAWDPADYLNGAVLYQQALKSPEWFNGEWWRGFWLLSSKIPPLTYILTVPFLNIFGISEDAATLVMLVFSGLLLVSVYLLGVCLFDVSVGLWAAGLCVLMPGLYDYRLEFLLDYPLTSIVTFSFCLLTLWYFQEGSKPLYSWLGVLGFGLSLGLAFMVKQTSLFFLFLPIVWAGISLIWCRQWGRLGQLILGLLFSILVFFPWYRTNWLLMLTAGKRATIDSALIEGDPSLNSLDAWTYYAKVLPYFLSWPLLLVPIVGFLMGFFYWQGRKDVSSTPIKKGKIIKKWLWLGVFLVGGYLLSSLNINKDARYILPLYPVLSLVLALGLLSWKGRWQNHIRWGTVIVATVVMLFNLFPLGGGAIASFLSPKMQHHPYMGKPWPNEEVIAEMVKTSPYLRSTLGVLPSTPELNQHNFSFYGAKYNLQVAGRQVGVRKDEIEADARSLDWFITKTGDQGSVPEAQASMVQRVEKGGDFTLQKTWSLPDDSTLSLYHRTQPLIEVNPISKNLNQVQLDQVIIPDVSPPGEPIPVTYSWSGPWNQLQSGIVILTWESTENKARWIHDHGIGMGALHPGMLKKEQLDSSFQVIEHTAMLPDQAPPGEYTLKATYLNRETGESYPITVPSTKINIEEKATATPAPELDLLTQLRTTTQKMGEGIKGIEPIFKLSNRINQYDSTQDYVKQADKALSYRLQDDKDINLAYALAISRVLQQDVNGAITALQQVIQLNPNNPYHYAYLAFVYLYDWRGNEAQQALQTALKLNPNIPELKTLSGVAALMQGNVFKAWHDLKG